MAIRVVSDALVVDSWSYIDMVGCALSNVLCQRIIRALVKRPRTLEELAQAAHIDKKTLSTVLRRLMELSIVARTEDGTLYLRINRIIIEIPR